MEREVLSKYKKQEDKLLISKIMDKWEFCKQKNKIETTDFLDLAEQKIAENFLKSQKVKNYLLVGGTKERIFERKIIVFYPDKLQEICEEGKIDFNSIFSVIRIILPNQIQEEYEHRNYLGALMKLGVKREKTGDIIVEARCISSPSQNTPKKISVGADIIIKPEMEKFLLTGLSELTRFKKSQIMMIPLEELRENTEQKEKIKITIPSMRIDSIVSELAHCSRNEAVKMMEAERVFINHESVVKSAKEVKQKDTLTIRGKGKFTIGNIVGNTKKDRIVLEIEKY